MNRSWQRIFLALLLVVFGRCENKELQPIAGSTDCSQSTLGVVLASIQAPTSCNSINGSISVVATGGIAPYDFSINAGIYQTGPDFTSLGSGIYTVTVKDSRLCSVSIQVPLSAPNSTLASNVSVAEDNQCLTPGGSISITSTGGQAPYRYQFGTGEFVKDSVFSHVKFGSYTITVKDTLGCLRAINVVVPRGNTGVSYSGTILNIINTSCAVSGCHDGSSTPLNWTIFSNVQNNAQDIKLRTGNKSMPLNGSLTQDQIDLIACWVDDGAKNN